MTAAAAAYPAKPGMRSGSPRTPPGYWRADTPTKSALQNLKGFLC